MANPEQSRVDYFKVLGLDRNDHALGDAAVKKAYRAKMQEFHPDKLMQAALKQGLSGKALEAYIAQQSGPSQLIGEAYEALKTEALRKSYRQFGQAASSGAARSAAAAASAARRPMDNMDRMHRDFRRMERETEDLLRETEEFLERSRRNSRNELIIGLVVTAVVAAVAWVKHRHDQKKEAIAAPPAQAPMPWSLRSVPFPGTVPLQR